MQYFLDSAKLDLIQEGLKYYPLDGVTTNPTILARDIEKDMSLKELLCEIRRLTVNKKLFVQVTSNDCTGMVNDAHTIIKFLGGDLTIKIPTTKEGFEAIKILKGESISTCSTACYSTSQALLAAKSGADYIAPYVSHLDNLSLDGPSIACDMARQIKENGLESQILAASFRTASQIERCISGGVTSVTVTKDMLDILSAHPGTDKELASFEKNWNARFDKGIIDLIG